MGRVPGRDEEMSLDEVRSEGLRQWNMDMDVEYQYETFNGLPVYYGGGVCDSEELEEYDPLQMALAAYAEDYNFDVPEGMELMTYTRSRLDGGETRGVDTVDMVSLCRTVSWVTHRVPDEPGGTSEKDTAYIEELDIEGFCRCPDFWKEEDSSVPSAGLNVNIDLGMSKQNGLNYVDVASMGDFDASGVDADEGSVAELEWNTWDDACAWEFRSASGNFPPDSDLGLPAGFTFVDMGDLPESHVSMPELSELVHKWPPAVINHMQWQQRELEEMRKAANVKYQQKQPSPCTFCGTLIRCDMYRHVARCHLELVQLWRCPVPWCTIWKGMPQDLMDHVRGAHNVPGEVKKVCLETLFPPWTVTRQVYTLRILLLVITYLQ